MNLLKRVFPVTVVFLLIAGTAFAQKNNKNAASKNISKKELKEFATVARALQNINHNSIKKMQNTARKNGLKMQRFQEIAKSEQNSKMADSLHITKKEQKEFKKIQPKLTKIRQKALKEFADTLQKNGLTKQRFRQIMIAVRTNKKLQQKVQKIMMKQMKSGGSGSQ